LNETQFNLLVDDLMVAIEEALDSSGVDLDYENAGSLLTITCEANGSQVIVSRQPALKEIWVAARSGGYHLNRDQGQWRCAGTGESLQQLLGRTLSEQAGEPVTLAF